MSNQVWTPITALAKTVLALALVFGIVGTLLAQLAYSDDPAVTVVQSTDLSLNKTANPVVLEAGDALTYTITFSNAGSFPALNVVVSDTVPSPVIVIGVSASLAITETSGAPNFEWEVKDLLPSETGFIQVTGFLEEDLDTPVSLVNSAGILSSTADDDLANNVDEARILVGPFILSLPLLTRNFSVAPDLVVDELVATSNGLMVTIRNAGSSNVTAPFWVDVYFNPSNPPQVNQPWDTIASQGATWGVTSMIAAGGSLTLTSGGPFYFPDLSSPPPLPAGAQVYAFVDSVNFATTYGNVQESNEGNNRFGPIISTAAALSPPPNDASQAAPTKEGLPLR